MQYDIFVQNTLFKTITVGPSGKYDYLAILADVSANATINSSIPLKIEVKPR